MSAYKEYMRSKEEEIRMHYMMEDEEWMQELIESVITSFDVKPEQVIRQIMCIMNDW